MAGVVAPRFGHARQAFGRSPSVDARAPQFGFGRAGTPGKPSISDEPCGRQPSPARYGSSVLQPFAAAAGARLAVTEAKPATGGGGRPEREVSPSWPTDLQGLFHPLAAVSFGGEARSNRCSCWRKGRPPRARAGSAVLIDRSDERARASNPANPLLHL
jgi:hypothetical protein